MEQFLLVPVSVYNKGLIIQLFTKRELPKYQPWQNPTYQIDSVKKEINKKLFSEADSLVDKLLSCPRIKLSSSLTLVLDCVETGSFLLDFAQQIRRKNADVPEAYFIFLTPLLYVRLSFWIRMPKLKRAAAGFLSKSECQMMNRLYTQGGAAYRSVRNLMKASNLSVSKWDNFYNQSHPIQNLLLPHVNSSEWRHLLNSNLKIGVWNWHTLIN